MPLNALLVSQDTILPQAVKVLTDKGWLCDQAHCYNEMIAKMTDGEYVAIFVDLFLYPETALDAVKLMKSKFNGSTPKNIFILVPNEYFNKNSKDWRMLKHLSEHVGVKNLLDKDSLDVSLA